MPTDHNALAGTQLHEPFHYVQEGDPGAVGAGKYWLKVSTGELKRRNAGDSGWDAVGASGPAAPTTAKYVTTLADAGLSAEVLVGTVFNSGAHSGRPAASTAGYMWLPTDAPFIQRDTGAAYQTWGPMWKWSEPDDSLFSWVNQGAASVVLGHGGIQLKEAGHASDNLRIRDMAAPATPYTLTIAYFTSIGLTNYTNCGLCWRDSVSGKVQTVSYPGENDIFPVVNWNSPSSWAGVQVSTARPKYPGSPLWLQIEDDGTNRKARVSTNGYYFPIEHSFVRTTHLTPDRIGIFLNMNAPNTQVNDMFLVHWLLQ